MRPQSSLPGSPLQDSFGRRFSYLRLSITDACNFRCAYCLPDGYKKPADETAPLAASEIENTVRAFAELGTVKVRLTGGEPTLRPDLLEIVERVARVPGIRVVGLSTNGHRLKPLAPRLAQAGVSLLNVSVDSLDPALFSRITGRDLLPEILEGIEAALEAGLRVKLNAVLLKSTDDAELALFTGWVRERPVTARFIELMPTGRNQEFFERNHLRADELKQRLRAWGWAPRERSDTDGPAVEFEHPDSLGRIGVIAPYSPDFCSTCNRLRMTSQGGLRLCLFGESSHPLRHLLGSPARKDELKSEIRRLLNRKEISHYLPKGIYGNNQTFSAIGG